MVENKNHDEKQEKKKLIQENKRLRKELAKKVRELADIAGTSEKTVQLNTQDEMPIAADGKKIFLGRVIRAKITGRPDQVSSSLNR